MRGTRGPPAQNRTSSLSYRIAASERRSQNSGTSEWTSPQQAAVGFPGTAGSPAMKTAAQEQRAMDERDANARAQAAGMVLPFPNVWDALVPKLAADASEADEMRWHREFADQCAPKRR
jgi:hypothetical protein